MLYFCLFYHLFIKNSFLCRLLKLLWKLRPAEDFLYSKFYLYLFIQCGPQATFSRKISSRFINTADPWYILYFLNNCLIYKLVTWDLKQANGFEGFSRHRNKSIVVTLILTSRAKPSDEQSAVRSFAASSEFYYFS